MPSKRKPTLSLRLKRLSDTIHSHVRGRFSDERPGVATFRFIEYRANAATGHATAH
jgi:hypothetical protein